jgi:SAM-dependent methyltransferase
MADGSCGSITCAGALEFVRDDQALIAEFARLLMPGGRLCLTVPNTGPFAGFDAFNLYHYLVDTTRRRERPPETEEVGWRRHYGVADLRELLEPRFRIRSVSTRRIGLSELVHAGLLVACRWVLDSEAAYRRSTAVVRRLARWEDGIRLARIGSILTIEAEKRADPR